MSAHSHTLTSVSFLEASHKICQQKAFGTDQFHITTLVFNENKALFIFCFGYFV